MEIVKINYSLQVASISSPNYDVKFDRICLGGFEYTIRSLRDLQQFSDPNGEALRLGISSAMWPLFGQIWAMGKILARVMLQEQLDGKRILEIGCGIGFPSLVIKQLGGDITASDYHPLAESFLIENTNLNHLKPIPFQTGDWNTANSKLGKFDLKTSSWIKTPAEIRKLGGALFADFRYETVFIYHNGAQSYYAARGFRGSLRV